MTFLVFLVSCQGQVKDNTAPQNNETNYVQQVNEPKNNDSKQPNDIAHRLVEIATAVPDVNDATAIVAGDYAVVGIDVNKDLERSRVGTIKYTVAEALKNDPHGANALVTADIDLNQRLNEMQTKINKGQPISGIMNELAEIVNRIMPDVPGELGQDEEEVEPTKQNDQQLNKEEQADLEREQEKQDLDR